MRRCKNLAQKSSPKNIWLSEDLFLQFSQSTECLAPGFHPELCLGGTTVRSAAVVAHDLIHIEANGKNKTSVHKIFMTTKYIFAPQTYALSSNQIPNL